MIKLTYNCPSEYDAAKFAREVIMSGWNMRYRAKDKQIDVLYNANERQVPIDFIQQILEYNGLNTISLEKTLKVSWRYEL